MAKRMWVNSNSVLYNSKGENGLAMKLLRAKPSRRKNSRTLNVRNVDTVTDTTASTS